MKKLTAIVFLIVPVLMTGVASAQSMYPYQSYGQTGFIGSTPNYSSLYNYNQNQPYSYGGYSGTSCVSLSLNLTVGSHGSDVSTLQSFLVSRGYPGSGNWMITGYFGPATRAALRTFQAQQGFPVTGYTDAATRAAIANVSCQNNGYSNTTYGNYNYNTSYNQLSVSPWYSNNTSYSNSYQPYPIATNNNGCPTNNTIIYGVYTGGYAPCSLQPRISYITPTTGSAGSVVTVYGSGFSSSGNTVYFGNTVITNIGSFDGQTLTFTVPTQINNNGTQLTTIGSYDVSVGNTSGVRSNAMQYIVTSLGSTYSPTVTSVNGPAAIAAGTQGTWNITVNTNNPSYYNNYLTVSVRWGDENTYGYAANAPQQATAASASQTLSFTHSYLTNSTYTIVFTVTNQNGQSTVSSQTVSVSGNNVSSGGVPVLSYISPLQARVGTQLILQGSQFSSYNNVVHFGSGGSLHVPSVNGNTIYYTIPSYVSPCDVQAQGGVCAAFYSQPITPGSTYPVYVSNANGQTSPISMTVQ